MYSGIGAPEIILPNFSQQNVSLGRLASVLEGIGVSSALFFTGTRKQRRICHLYFGGSRLHVRHLMRGDSERKSADEFAEMIL